MGSGDPQPSSQRGHTNGTMHGLSHEGDSQTTRISPPKAQRRLMAVQPVGSLAFPPPCCFAFWVVLGLEANIQPLRPHSFKYRPPLQNAKRSNRRPCGRVGLSSYISGLLPSLAACRERERERENITRTTLFHSPKP